MTDYYGAQQYPAPFPARSRPTGVTILAILDVLAGVLMLLLGVGMLIALALVGDPVFQEVLQSELPTWALADLSMLLAAMTVLLLAVGVVFIALAYGFLNGKRWAWILAIAFGFLNVGSSVLSALLSLSLSNILTLGFSLVVPVLIIIYLFQPNVKEWFQV